MTPTPIPPRTFLAIGSDGRGVTQALPDDDRRAETLVAYLAERCLIAAEEAEARGEQLVWTFVVRQPFQRVCCGAHVDHPHAPDCDERPRCPRCHRPVHYRRGITGGLRSSGTSGYVHDDTGELACRRSAAAEPEALEVPA